MKILTSSSQNVAQKKVQRNDVWLEPQTLSSMPSELEVIINIAIYA